MNVVFLTPPGRFPTIVPDPGWMWSVAVARGHQAVRYSANAAWWRHLSSPAVQDSLLAPLGLAVKLHRRVEWTARGVDLRASALRASKGLNALTDASTYQSADRYVNLVGTLAEHIEALNDAQSDFVLSLSHGAHARAVDYADSRALAAHATADTALARTVAAALEGFPREADLVMVFITSAEDLLCAMIAARELKRRRPGIHVCLADHGYEDFSLHPHMPKLEATGALAPFFDTVIVSKDDRATILADLLSSLEDGGRPRGFLRREAPASPRFEQPAPFAAPPPVEVFAPEPIFWTRVSERRCYWSRCAFCIQNAKYDNPQSPSRAEIRMALERLHALRAAGYRTFVFSDEALAPGFLDQFSDAIVDAGLDIRWSCRCRLERAFNARVFAKMRRAGCYEVLYGLESISPRILRLMRKHDYGLNEAHVREIIRAMTDAGIGIHLTMIGGFPGERPDELQATADFVADAARNARDLTFRLNRFELFPDTPVLRSPATFGVIPVGPNGDMPSVYAYTVAPELADTAAAVHGMIGDVETRLHGALGWGVRGSGAEAARHLYFHSGHGALFKSRGDNPFSNPLERADRG